MTDKKGSLLDQATTIDSGDRIFIIKVTGANTENYTISLKEFFEDLDVNAHFIGVLSSANGMLINGGGANDLLTVNCHSILREITRVNELRVCNTHIQLANTYTPAGNTVSGAMANGVQFFADGDYMYVSVNGTVRRAALEDF